MKIKNEEIGLLENVDYSALKGDKATFAGRDAQTVDPGPLE